MDSALIKRLPAFLCAAKRHTYAGLDDAASVAAPLLEGSKQLHYSDRDLAYRDIYFGLGFFVGQETVAAERRVVWSMSYGGGASANITERDQLLAIYAFLRQALLAVPEDRPFRGPARFERNNFHYANDCDGDVRDFHGAEHVFLKDVLVYRLHYNGGLIR